ncbi:hypothetical protein C1646_678023 [Rhizophagus diaphanus]|nr:hypothetical protein C1646_678023 [Rhizophagus diaphanus] [Rhizophagus sp. MUCL 43196]
MTKKFENKFENLNTLEDIHEKSKDNSNLKIELEKCIITKNEVFETENPASDLEINEMFEIKKYNQTTYSICYPIRMPIDIFQSLHFLPDPVPSRENLDHYETFVNLYGKFTTKKFHPSLISLESKTEPAPKKVGNILICYWCGIDKDFITVPQSLQEKFKLVYSLCNTCNESGKTFYKWLEKKVNGKRQKTSHNSN